MAKKSVIARSNKTPKFASRVVRRCFRCGRKHGYMKFWLPADTNIYEGYAVYCDDVRIYTEPEVEYYFKNT